MNQPAEATFGIEELFFSRTDKRGVILAGNEVFYRVSEYDWDEILNAPHKIIRHQDTPRAVFKIMWDMIQQGKPAGAYVKNRTKNGAHYWVFAVVTPMDGGYLSVRLRPSSDLHEKIVAEYRDLRAREEAENLSPDASEALLVERLQKHGFHSYTAFMTRALIAETKARDGAIAGDSKPDPDSLQALSSLSRDGEELAGTIAQDIQRLNRFPVNLLIQASKLKSSGKLFGAVADNFSRICGRIATALERFSNTSQNTSQVVDLGLFKLLIARYQQEMVDLFQREIDNCEGDAEPPFCREDEMLRLRTQQESYRAEAAEGLKDIAAVAGSFESQTKDLHDMVAALGTTQTLGLIETARLDKDGRTISAMLEGVSSVQQKTSEDIKQLAVLSAQLCNQSQALRSACQGGHA